MPAIAKQHRQLFKEENRLFMDVKGLEHYSQFRRWRIKSYATLHFQCTHNFRVRTVPEKVD